MPIALPQLPRWGLVLAGAVAGSAAVLAFAPFHIWPVAVVAVAAFYLVLENRSRGGSFLAGWGFGSGLLGFGIFWIRISLNEFGNMPPLVAHLLTLLFILAMALYYGLAGWLVRALGAGGTNTLRQDPREARLAGPLLILPGVWVLLEWLRGWLFTGFPWLALGYTQVDGPLGGLAPVVGVYGVSLAVVFSGGLLWVAVRAPGRARWIALASLIGLWSAGAGLRLVDWTHAAGAPLRASVVQANIQPSMKWDPEALVPVLQAHLELTREHLESSDLIVWPETAVPAFLDEVRDGLIEPLTTTAQEEGAAIVLGIPYRELGTGRYYNGLLSIGAQEDLYAKRHLVPFGEFMPFKAWVGPLAKMFEVPMSDFSRGEPGGSILKVNGVAVGASICYEDAFPEEVIRSLPAAAYLINVSNDAWFGDSLAPYQHLEIARMRALEAGRPLVRATNTGVSAILDHHGSVLGSIPLGQRAGLTVEIQPRAGATPFVAVGNWLAIGLALLMAVAGAAVAKADRAGSPHPRRADQAAA
jgi:apolipoprotein N-acyltransferase